MTEFNSQAWLSREGCAPGSRISQIIPGYPHSSCSPRSFLGAGSLWDLFHGCRSHFWSMTLIPPRAVWGRWDVSKAIWNSASLSSGTECPCHGKIPWEELWHLPAAPALAVITPPLFHSLGGWDEHPQLLGDVPAGPCRLLQGNSRHGDQREWGQACQHLQAFPSLESAVSLEDPLSTPFPWGGKSVGPRVLPGKPQN